MTTPTQQIKNFLNKSANAFEENSSFSQLEQALYNAEKAGDLSMILDMADIEILRLIGWSKNLPTELDKLFNMQIFSEAGMETFQKLGLVAVSSGKLYRLKPRGQGLLESAGYDYPQDSKYVSVDKTLIRRKEGAGKLPSAVSTGINSIELFL